MDGLKTVILMALLHGEAESFLTMWNEVTP
jgi:hypothetical protein